jgi:hypothetical protein
VDICASLRPDLSAHAQRRTESRHGVSVDRRSRRWSDGGDDKVGVAAMWLVGAILVLTRHDLDLVSEFLKGQRPGGVGLEIARDQTALVEFEFLETQATSSGRGVGLGCLRGRLLVWAVGRAVLVSFLPFFGRVDFVLRGVRGVAVAPVHCVRVVFVVVVPFVVGQERVARIFGGDRFRPAGGC